METDGIPLAPKYGPDFYTNLRAAFEAGGAERAIESLADDLGKAGEFQQLFYALLLTSRVKLGVSPFPTGPAADMPPDRHEAYETAIRDAGRYVGGLHLQRGEIAKAWPYFRMLQEPAPVKAALAAWKPGPDDDIYPLVEIAWQQGLAPELGFDWVLDRSGVCSAITMVGSSDFAANPTLRDYCIQRLVHALHAQLRERLMADLTQRGLSWKPEDAITAWIAEYPELTADDAYHIDTSHLSSVVSSAMQLSPGPDLDLARELAAYGAALSPMLSGSNDPPFENVHKDYLPYLNAIAGVDLDASLAHFEAKIEQAVADGYQFPVEVLVNLYLKLNRPTDALNLARKHLADEDDTRLTCPGVLELARRVGDYDTYRETAAAKNDPVQWLAALISDRGLRNAD